jgi:acetyl-CoA carboxylase biotin carboxyl carrier protein
MKKKAAAKSEEALVERLAELLHKHDLTEIEYEKSGTRVRLRRGGGGEAVAPHLIAHAPSAPAPTASESDGNMSYITSPFVGTFYRSPSPEAAPFVEVGQRVKKGQVLCIVEAMKLMNEIESEIDGTVVQIMPENSQPVEYGEPLFKIKLA